MGDDNMEIDTEGLSFNPVQQKIMGQPVYSNGNNNSLFPSGSNTWGTSVGTGFSQPLSTYTGKVSRKSEPFYYGATKRKTTTRRSDPFYYGPAKRKTTRRKARSVDYYGDVGGYGDDTYEFARSVSRRRAPARRRAPVRRLRRAPVRRAPARRRAAPRYDYYY